MLLIHKMVLLDDMDWRGWSVNVTDASNRSVLSVLFPQASFYKMRCKRSTATSIQLGVLFITHNIDEAIFLAQRIIVMSAHPGTIQDDIRVELSYPRSRTSREFGELYTRIGQELHR